MLNLLSDTCIGKQGNKEYLRNYMEPNPRTYVSSKGYSFTKKTGKANLSLSFLDQIQHEKALKGFLFEPVLLVSALVYS